VKIIEKVTETVERDEVKEVHCNLCGEPDDNVDLPTLDASGRWKSTFPPDKERWTSDICEHCVAALFLVCTIPPDVYNEATGEEEQEPGGKMAALLAGQWCGGDSRAVIKSLQWIVSSATRRLASLAKAPA
jgi:hypothetical protein